MEQLPEWLQPYWPYIYRVILAIIILIVGWIFSKWAFALVARSIRKTKADEALARFIGGIAQYAVLAAAVISAIGALGVQTTSLVAIFASAGLAVGLALQGSLGNFASGVLILFFKPFKTGDVVTLDGKTGNVIDIGLFATTVLTLEKEHVIIPNGKITSDTIINRSTEGMRRVTTEVGVAYGADVDQVRDILVKAGEKTTHAMSDPAPHATFANLGASSLDFKLFTYCTPENFVEQSYEARRNAYDALNEAGIEIPFTQIVLHQAEAAEA